MTQTLATFLNSVHADADVVQQALRTYLSERTDDLTQAEMLAQMRAATSDEAELDRLRAELEHDPDAVEQAALAFFEYAWQDPQQRPAIRAAFEHAKDRLPVIETAIICITVMYAMHLRATEGVTKEEITTKKKKDGSFEETKKKEFEPFAPIVSAITRLFRKG